MDHTKSKGLKNYGLCMVVKGVIIFVYLIKERCDMTLILPFNCSNKFTVNISVFCVCR